MALPAVLIGLAGGVAYITFLALKYGNPLEFAVAQNVEGWASSSIIVPQGPMDVFNMLFLPLTLFLVFQGRKVLKTQELWWIILTVVMSLARWPSMSRLTMVLYPLFMVAALTIRQRRTFVIVATASAALLVINTIRFALWYWVA